MSSRLVRHVSCILTVLLAASQEVAAQSIPARVTKSTGTDSIAAAIARVDSALKIIVPLHDAAVRDFQQYDSLTINRLPSDTVRVGGIRALTDPSLEHRIQAALEQAWPEIHASFGSLADSSLARRTFLFRFRANSEGAKDTVIDMAEVRDGIVDIFDRVPANEGQERIASGMMTKAAMYMRQKVDSAFFEWMGSMMSAEREGPRIISQLYIDLVTAPSQAVGRCLVGDILRCRDALGLTPIADPLTEWYSAEERRLLLIGKRTEIRSRDAREAYDQCVNDRVYRVCDRVIRSLREYKLRQPLSNEARHYVVRVAIDMGGSGAFNRLVAGKGRTPSERITDAARAPIDTVVARWRNNILAAAPKGQVVPVRTAWATVAWGTLFGIFALGSRRWI